MATVPTVTRHPDYDKMLPEVTKVRDAVMGAFFVKRKGMIYLPHPSEVDQTSEAALQRYIAYVKGAEFDEVAGITMRNMIGRAELNRSTFDFPERIQYLTENADNDGTPLVGQIESVFAEVLQMKFCVLVAEYVNAPETGERLTPADVKARGLRAAIKLYNRESVIDWAFTRINGVMQLSYLKLMEKKQRLDIFSGSRVDYEEYLHMALDDNGDYFWWRSTLDSGNQPINTAYVYPKVGGSNIKWLPVQISSDIALQPGKLPLELGFLSPIVDKVMHRYIKSAAYSEAMDSIPPTVNTSGWTSQSFELFSQMNQRDYVVVGKGTNNLPEGVTMDVISPDAKLEHFVKFKEQNATEIRALGGEFAGDETAGKSDTQSRAESADKAAKMLSIVNNVERCYRRLALYCGMFEGIYQQSDIESNIDDIVISLNKEFSQAQPSVEMGKFIVNELKLSGLVPDSELIKMLQKSGFVDDAEMLINMQDGGEV